MTPRFTVHTAGQGCRGYSHLLHAKGVLHFRSRIKLTKTLILDPPWTPTAPSQHPTLLGKPVYPTGLRAQGPAQDKNKRMDRFPGPLAALDLKGRRSAVPVGACWARSRLHEQLWRRPAPPRSPMSTGGGCGWADKKCHFATKWQWEKPKHLWRVEKPWPAAIPEEALHREGPAGHVGAKQAKHCPERPGRAHSGHCPAPGSHLLFCHVHSSTHGSYPRRITGVVLDGEQTQG